MRMDTGAASRGRLIGSATVCTKQSTIHGRTAILSRFRMLKVHARRCVSRNFISMSTFPELWGCMPGGVLPQQHCLDSRSRSICLSRVSLLLDAWRQCSKRKKHKKVQDFHHSALQIEFAILRFLACRFCISADFVARSYWCKDKHIPKYEKYGLLRRYAALTNPMRALCEHNCSAGRHRMPHAVFFIWQGALHYLPMTAKLYDCRRRFFCWRVFRVCSLAGNHPQTTQIHYICRFRMWEAHPPCIQEYTLSSHLETPFVRSIRNRVDCILLNSSLKVSLAWVFKTL